MSIAGAERALIEAALRNCSEQAECEIPLKGEAYVSSSLESEETGNGGYQLRSWQSVDAAVRPIHSILRGVFLLTGVGALAGAVFVSGLSSRSIVRPIMGVIAHLRKAEKTGELPEFRSTAEYGRIREIRELTGTFNRAGAAIREARARLERANVEFIESLASALDARDPYTAGHSRRVSEFACAIADAMGLDRNALGEIRIGALLHDIGKIGVSDSVLLKPGRLTPEENALIQQHPSIGRRILEGVNGFQPYLGVVELHHENWDGTGYPHGLRGEDTPQTARIVKLADAYDAMTSDRPYRKGMSHQEALVIFEKVAGSQMDPAVVEAFQNLEPVALHATAAQNGAESLRRLAEAVQDVKRRESALEPVEGNRV